MGYSEAEVHAPFYTSWLVNPPLYGSRDVSGERNGLSDFLVDLNGFLVLIPDVPDPTCLTGFLLNSWIERETDWLKSPTWP